MILEAVGVAVIKVEQEVVATLEEAKVEMAEGEAKEVVEVAIEGDTGAREARVVDPREAIIVAILKEEDQANN